MSDCKQKYIEWSTDNGCYCGEYKEGNLKGLMCGNDARNEFDAWEACWNARQSEIDQLKAEKAGLLKLAEQWREQAKELCRVDDKYVIGSVLSCAEELEERCEVSMSDSIFWICMTFLILAFTFEDAITKEVGCQ